MNPPTLDSLNPWRCRVSVQEAGVRLDRFLIERVSGATRGDVVGWIDSGRIRCDGRPGRKGDRLRPGVLVEVDPPSPRPGGTVEPEPELDLPVLWEDSWLVALSKPSGVPSHPLRGKEGGTVANFLAARYPEMQGIGYSPVEMGLLHRLDRDTSGVIVAARTSMAFEQLRKQFQQGRVVKVYLAVVLGCPGAEGIVSLPIGSRGRRERKVIVCAEPGVHRKLRSAYPAETAYRRIRTGNGCSLVRLVMRTGVRHQIRAHLSHLGHPVAGDGLYGPGSGPSGGLIPPPPRQLLHASEIRFVHPEDDRRDVRILCPLPADFRASVQAYGLGGPDGVGKQDEGAVA